jgi:YVTN family beta-propeller protein
MATLCAGSTALGGIALAHGDRGDGRVGPALSTTSNGRHLSPVGRLTTVGNFPSGGALTGDGRFYWAVDSGHGTDDVQIVDVATGTVVQTLPLPGAYGGIAFSPDGQTAYVSGEPKGSSPTAGPTVGDGGDVIHVFSIDAQTGKATEQTPIALPATTGGHAQKRPTDKGWPEGLAVTGDGKRLVVALNQADQTAIVELDTGQSRLVKVGVYPSGVATAGATAFVTNEYSGTVSVIDTDSGTVTDTIGVGGSENPDGSADPNQNAHPKAIIIDPHRDQAYVAVANRDAIAVLDTKQKVVTHYVSVARPEGYGAQPVALAESPDGQTLYSADAGEDAVAAIALTDRAGRRGESHDDELTGLHAFDVIGKLPTASYPTGVATTPDGSQLLWLSAKGLGAGPNPDYGVSFSSSNAAPYGTYVLDMLLGRVGVLPRPTDREMARLTERADRQVRPVSALPLPRETPIAGSDGGPSRQIKHVFYIVRENRTYDQVLGSDPRGDGDPSLEVADDNGVAGPAGGVTPNAHALARAFPLLDHLYADSEVSQDGHKVVTSGYGTDFVERNQHAGYSGRGRTPVNDNDPAAAPPRDYLFDQAIRQGVSFRNYGEYGAGTAPESDDGRPTYAASVAGKDTTYPGAFGCNRLPLNTANCATDRGTLGTGPGQTAPNSRFDTFESEFAQQLKTGTVPALSEFILPNDHTNGTKPGFPTPRALLADNDLGLGQIVDLISHSPIWRDSAIFVVEDDSQDGADHVDAHRMPAFVISPYARRKAVVHTRYDQDSVLHTIELILGLRPLSLFDAMATPMAGAFTPRPDFTPYRAIQPGYPLDAVNGPNAPDAKLSDAMPFSQVDAVPQAVSDRILWHSVYGRHATPARPGPNASMAEHARARIAMRGYGRGANLRRLLAEMPEHD